MQVREKLSKIRLEPHEKAPRGPGQRLPRGAWLAIGGAIALLLLIGAFLVLGGPNEDSTEVASTAPAASATDVAPAAFSGPRTLAAGGYVEARRTALVWPGRDGIVAEVHVVRGQRVKEGDLLLELDARTAAAVVEMARAEVAAAGARLLRLEQGARGEELAAARAELEEAAAQHADARADLERLLPLGEGELVSAAEVERAGHKAEAAAARVATLRSREELLQVGTHPAELAAAEAEVERQAAALRQAEVNLDLTRVRAPFDGTVITIQLEPGEVVSLFDVGSGIEIADQSALWVRVDVPEDRIAGLALGDPAEVFAQAAGSQALAARVVEIAPKADRQSNTVEVAVAIADPPPVLRPDMSARVNIVPSGGSE
jgi:multidrug resistance efflux pump